MLNIKEILVKESNIELWRIENALKLREEGGTLPFIARYRKEQTGTMDENQLRDMFDRADYLEELEKRKEAILKSIEEQGKLTEELRLKIENCLVKNELEDLYLPYKPKRRTRATIAKEKGLEPLAVFIKEANTPESPKIDLTLAATDYISIEKGVETAEDALAGASDIIAEEIAETAELRAWVRNFFTEKGTYKADIKKEFELGSTKYEAYRNFSIPVREIASHVMLALRRGEAEGFINLDLDFEEDLVLTHIEGKTIESRAINIQILYKNVIKDAFARLMQNSLVGEVRLESKKSSDEKSINVFESNMRNILLSAPAGLKPTMGIDPGFRTGCKVAIIDETGKYITYKPIFLFGSDDKMNDAKLFIFDAIAKYKIELIAIGNGTAGREAEKFVRDLLKDAVNKPVIVTVNESGASIYSASKLAGEEFPELDLTVRGAISIGRRLQDPLAELVKIDPKSIGVGQYQHDVDQKLLQKKLTETVESCVNYVGVDLNTSSKELLTYVSGINSRLAESIVKFRNENGTYKNRRQLMKVSGFGDKAFQLSAGFLRIRNGENKLDNTAVHPESYHIVEKIAKDNGLSIDNIEQMREKISSIDIKKYVTEEIGEPTLRDIVKELEKPGRDPREEFKYAEFDDSVKEIKDLKVGMELEGVITNVTNFGAFVDIGVHQDGLVHKSQIADKFVADPTDFVKAGQIVKVRVLDIDEKLNRIQLTMKSDKPREKKSFKNERQQKQEPSFSLDDLKAKFGK
jgi:uncharacterized protein